MRSLKFALVWLTGGWLLIATVLVNALLPDPAIAPGIISDKVLHLIVFMGLTAWFAGIYQRGVWLRLALAMLVLGALIELLQGMIANRDPSWLDWFANGAGVFAALLLSRFGLDRWCEWIEGLLGVKR